MDGTTRENLGQQAVAILSSSINDCDKIDRLVTLGIDYEDILEIIFGNLTEENQNEQRSYTNRSAHQRHIIYGKTSQFI